MSFILIIISLVLWGIPALDSGTVNSKIVYILTLCLLIECHVLLNVMVKHDVTGNCLLDSLNVESDGDDSILGINA